MSDICCGGGCGGGSRKKSNPLLSTAGTFSLASVLTSYPDEKFFDSIASLQAGLPEGDWTPVAHILATLDTSKEGDEQLESEEQVLTNLRSLYIDLFDSGHSKNPLYETEYGRMRSMSKPNELADIMGFYKAFGFDLAAAEDKGEKEMADHLGVELEFYSMLLLKQYYLESEFDKEGSEIVLEARKKFLTTHLGRFTNACATRPGVLESSFYGPTLAWVDEIVRRECLSLGVVPEPIHYIGEQQEDDVCCGASEIKRL